MTLHRSTPLERAPMPGRQHYRLARDFGATCGALAVASALSFIHCVIVCPRNASAIFRRWTVSIGRYAWTSFIPGRSGRERLAIVKQFAGIKRIRQHQTCVVMCLMCIMCEI